MNRTRWKLMIGAFGLGAAGLAAVAAGPGSPGCTPAPQSSAKAPAEPPLTLPVPPLPTAPPPVIPASGEAPAVALPALPTPADVKPVTPTVPALPLPVPPSPKPGIELEVKLPSPPAGKPEPTKPAVLTVTAPPGTTFTTSADLPKPGPPTQPPAAPDKPPVFKTDGGAFLQPAAPPPVMFAEPAKPADRIPPTPVTDAPRPAAPTLSEPVAAPKQPVAPAGATGALMAEKKLTVMLHMGDERPKFEIKDQNEVYLKVASDRVDVQSPKDGRANQSVMRATGKVAFVTPGGEGTCDELAVVPGTGQVTVTGNVAFTYNWGKVETTVTGEKMTFRLGGTPGATDRPTAMR